MRYDGLNWESLDFIKAHFYRRVATPLNKTIEILERVENVGDKTLAVRRLSKTRQTVEALLNAVNAWATLITYKSNGPLDDFQFKLFTRDQLPAWFHAYLGRETSLRVDFDHTLRVHQETLIEGMVLLFNIAQTISNVYSVQMSDSPGSRKGVFMRVIFSNRDERAPFGSLSEILDTFDYEVLGERDLAVQLAVARDMMLLNKARFSLQNNKKTGQQAFSAYFDAYESVDEEENSAPLFTAPELTPHVNTAHLIKKTAPLSLDADPNAPGESEPDRIATRTAVPETRPLSISREMVEKIEERLKAIRVVDEEAFDITPTPASDNPRDDRYNGKRDGSDKEAHTPFGW
jgi:hypothetical protein